MTIGFALIGLSLVVVWAIVWPRPPLDRLVIAGRPLFLAGANYPWKTGQDFGTGAWGHTGVSNPTTYAEIETDFANMAAAGVRVVKWRVFGDGRYSPDFDAGGAPVGLDDYFFKDVDAALEIARRYDVYLVLALFDSGFWRADCSVKGAQLGGHVDVLTDPAKRQALIEQAIRPFARHVAGSDRVIAYEVLAEPDWGVQELNTDADGRQKVSLEQAQAFVRDIVGAIRAESSALVTVEANRSRNMTAWRGLGLDYYSFSWYDWLEPYDPLNTAAASFGLDRPVVVGEFPVQSTTHELSRVLDIALSRGYAGAFAWSFAGIDRYGALTDQAATFMSWLQAHWPSVSFLGPTPPSGSFQRTPPPYALEDVRVGPAEAGIAVEADLFLRDREQVSVHLYATPVGRTETVADLATTVAPDEAGRATVRATVLGLAENRPYALSLGIFAGDGRMLKWFDGIAHVELSDGSVRTPDLPPIALENPCHG